MTYTGADEDHTVFNPRWGTGFLGDGSVRFRLWAPAETVLFLKLETNTLPMNRSADGWFEATVNDDIAGGAYSFVLEDGTAVPDPAARAQAGDVHGPSLVVDPGSYSWDHADWRGRQWHEAIIYELHIGTFTPEGTFRAAIGRLAHLAALGVTMVEIMPVAQFGGERGWGYDGVFHYAPHNAYGTPDDLKALVDAAHGLGLMVMLDVVYNHFGPDGNYLQRYAPDFFHPEKHTPWGAAIAFEEKPVRQYFVDNALYWLSEFHLDGLRFDAIDRIEDDDLIVEIATRIRQRFTDRHIHLVTEDPRNLTYLRREAKSPKLYDGDWNDDYHHAVHALATGEVKGYYSDFEVDPLGKVARALANGYVFPGKPPAGEDQAQVSPAAFVSFLQNHDQTGNRAFGERLISLTSGELLAALTAITILSPHIPLIFMGEEFGETQPFLFFTDYSGDLATAVRDGRRKEVENFGGIPKGRREEELPDPNALETMRQSRLDWAKLETPDGRTRMNALTELLRLRNQFIVPLLARSKDDNATGRIVAAAGGLLAIDWRFGDSVLQLRANLGSKAADAGCVEGEIVYSNIDDRTGDSELRLPACGVVFAIALVG